MFIACILGQYKNMIHLLIDIGNTRIKWMFLDDVAVNMPLDESYSAVVHYKEFDNAVAKCFSGLDFPNNTNYKIVVSNVAGHLARQALENFFSQYSSCELLFLEVERQCFGIYNSYKTLSELGVDRWISIIGARQLQPKGAVVVVNSGTAITVDYLSGDNQYKGGAILPGFDLVLSSLSSADGIAHYDFSNTKLSLGVTTKDCVSHGVMSACVGGVEKMLATIFSSIEKNDKDHVHIIVSGGAGSLFLNNTRFDGTYDANLVFRGLRKFSL